jgi:hypothetical protein
MLRLHRRGLAQLSGLLLLCVAACDGAEPDESGASPWIPGAPRADAAPPRSDMPGRADAGEPGTNAGPRPNPPHPTPDDPREYISAEGRAGQATGEADAGAAGAGAGGGTGGGGSTRTVEEGDIYRSLAGGKLLNLNPYRGLQVIDVSDVSRPHIIGRLRDSGQPVEMYVVGERALVLLNNWTGYWGSRDDVMVERQSGGLVLSVDLSDPRAPRVTDREFVNGAILTSRLTRQDARAILYVAATEYSCENAAECPRTVVKSIDASSADLIPRTTLNLGGYVNAVQATPDALIVARQRYDAIAGTTPPASLVSLVDISDPEGQMREGGQVQVKGQIQNKFNLDLRGGVLRVVSGSSWWGITGSANHLETFATTDLMRPRPLAHCSFGDGQQLFATLFMQDRAFFVTYLRQDPFHAFSIDANGDCRERNEFVVSGWNDFFKPVFDERRLIGIGSNDEVTRNVAVSLYDVTVLTNPNPLVARKEVAAQNSWSQASWDDKAFSVIEGAVQVPARDDPAVTETGLVLVPFQGWDQTTQKASAGVQIFTFSEHTLSRRGSMEHGQQVSRSFQLEADQTANLSAEELSLFDAHDPDAPVETGRVELAPSYSDVHDYGSFLVRVRDTRAAYRHWWNPAAEPPPAYFEVIPSEGDPDSAEPLARVAISAGSRTFKVGSLLVAISTRSGGNSATYHSVLRIYDLRDPRAPALRSSLESDRLLPAYGYGWGAYSWGLYPGGGVCGVGIGNYYDDFSRVLPDVLVLGRNLPQNEPMGQYEVCSWSGAYTECAYDENKNCEWDAGYQSCERKIGTTQSVCTNTLHHCVREDGVVECTPLGSPPASAFSHCSTYEQYRYWQSMELDVLDLRNPSAPTLSPVTFDRKEEAVGLVTDDHSLYFAFKRPHTVSGDHRPFAKYFFREVDLADPTRPAVGTPVNVPGELLAVQGERLFTRDLRWGPAVAETSLHALRRDGDSAELLTSREFAGREVSAALLDGASRVFVAHRAIDVGGLYIPGAEPSLDKLTVLGTDGLSQLGEMEVDIGSELTQAIDGRALFSVPGGMLVVNARDPAAPYAQAFFPYSGWNRRVSYDGARILVASGPYGLFRLDATTENLLRR